MGAIFITYIKKDKNKKGKPQNYYQIFGGILSRIILILLIPVSIVGICLICMAYTFKLLFNMKDYSNTLFLTGIAIFGGAVPPLAFLLGIALDIYSSKPKLKETESFIISTKKHIELPFDEPPKEMVMADENIFERNFPILYVYRDKENGRWEFYNKKGEAGSGIFVTLYSVYMRDETIEKLAKMPPGYSANRKNRKDEWVIEKMGGESEAEII